jgi:hypothetical protein
MQRVRFAFKADGGQAWTGGDSTYSARLSHEELTLVPRHSVAGKTIAGAPLGLRTVQIARDASIAEKQASTPAERDKDGSLIRSRGPAVERFRNTPDGLEQTWAFSTRPAGKSDLIVRIKVTGLEYLAETPAGLHFADPKTGLGFRYGTATWIDADGRRLTVPPVFVDGQIVLRVPAATVEAASYPTLLDPVIGPEFRIDEPVFDARYFDGQPAVAFNGTNYLVAWSTRNADIVAARVKPDGTVLDVGGIVIGATADSEINPAIASNGTDWLVAYSIQNASLQSLGTSTMRVSSAGVLLDPYPIPVTLGSKPAVAYGGGNYLVVTEKSGSLLPISGRLVSPGGGTVGSVIQISVKQHGEQTPGVAFNGTDFYVAWSEITASKVFGTRVSAAGAVATAGGTELADPETARRVSVANVGTGFLVAWGSTSTGPYWWSVRAVPVDSAGTKGTEIGVGAGAAAASYSGWDPLVSATSNGSDYVVAWNDADYTKTWAARVSASGTLLDSPAIALPNGAADEGYVAVTGNGSSYFAVWGDTRNDSNDTESDIYGQALSSTLASAATGSLISRSASSQYYQALAFNGTSYLAAWLDDRESAPGLYGSRVAPDGTVLDTDAIAINTVSGGKFTVAATSTGSGYFLVWEDQRNGLGDGDVMAARLDDDGNVLDPTGKVISATATTAEEVPSVATNGTSYLVVWEDSRNYATTGRDIYAARVDDSGNLIAPGVFAVTTASGDQRRPEVGYDGTDYVVIWDEAATYQVRGTRVTTAGALRDTPFLVANGRPSSPYPMAMASGSGHVLVAMQLNQLQPVVQICRIQAGVPACNTMTPGGNTSQYNNVAAAWDGFQYWVAWSNSLASQTDVYLSRVSAVQLSHLDGSNFNVTSTPSVSESGPVLIGGPLRRVMLAYGRPGSDTTTAALTTRIHARLLDDLLTTGTTCSADSECSSGHCADAVCCDDVCDGPCEACSAVKKGSGSDGACAAIKVGTDPDNECATQAASTCGTDGYCDGAGACRLYPATTNCAAPLCTNNGVQPQRCDGSGSCVLGTAGPDCAPYLCADGACQDPCAYDSDCVANYYCAAGKCTAKAPQGGACPSDNGCLSGPCVDDVCCDSACNGSCEACSSAKKGGGTSGVCGPILAGVDSGGDCAVQSASTCGTDGTCDGARACRLYPTGTACTAATCSGNAVQSSSCDGSGACLANPLGADCSPYLCGSGACRSPCVDDSNCVADYFCSAGECVHKQAQGAACSGDNGCLSGPCVDGVCCNAACDGPCEACSQARRGSGTDGECGPIAQGVDSGGDCAAEPASTCGTTGTCDGQGACEVHAMGTVCAPRSCAGSTLTEASECDGDGTCVVGTASPCGSGEVCDADGVACVPGTAATGGTGSGGTGSGGTAGSGNANGGGSDSGGSTFGGAMASAAGQDGTMAETAGASATAASDDGGCGCRVATRRAPIPVELAPLLLFGLLLRRRLGAESRSRTQRITSRACDCS